MDGMESCDTAMCAVKALQQVVTPLLPDAAGWSDVLTRYPASQAQEEMREALAAYRDALNALHAAMTRAGETAARVQAALPRIEEEVDELPPVHASEGVQDAFAWRHEGASAFLQAARTALA